MKYFLIGQYVVKIWTKVEWHLFMAHGVAYTYGPSCCEDNQRQQQQQQQQQSICSPHQ